MVASKKDDSSSTTPKLEPKKPKSILLVGDSLAQGLAAPMGHLAKSADVRFVADGRVSTKTTDWSFQPWLRQDLSQGPFDLVLVSLGTNDMKLDNPALIGTHVDAIIALILATKANVAWVMPPKMPFPDGGVRGIIAKRNIPIFKSDTIDIPRAPDGVHPTVSGYAGWAGQVWKWIFKN